MNKKEIEKWTKSVQEKLGKDNAGKIADDLGLLITDNATMNEIQEKQTEEIKTLQEDKERLLTVNANLLQQIPMGKEEKKEEEVVEVKKVSYRDCFDEKGNFKI